MTTAAALDQVWAQLTARLERAGVPVFPAMPLADCTPIVDWPGADWPAFLNLAARVNAPLIYAQPHRVADRQLEALTAAADALEAAAVREVADQDDIDGDDVGDEPDVLIDADANVRHWRTAAACRAGTIGRVEIGFVVGGVLHQWADETDEYAELTAACEEAAEAVEQLREAAAERAAAADRAARGMASGSALLVSREGEKLLAGLRPKVQEWAQQLVASAEFIGGSSQQARWGLAGDVIPELGEWRELPDRRESPQSWARHWTATSACMRAEELLPAVKERRLAALRGQVNEIAAKLAADPDFAGRRTKQVRRQLVRDLVTTELGFGSAELTDLVLELADARRGT